MYIHNYIYIYIYKQPHRCFTATVHMATIVCPWFSCSHWPGHDERGVDQVEHLQSQQRTKTAALEMMRRYTMITNYLLEDPFGSMVSPFWNRVDVRVSVFSSFQRVHDVLDIDDGKDSWNYYPGNVERFNASLDDSISQISMKSQATVATNRLSRTRHIWHGASCRSDDFAGRPRRWRDDGAEGQKLIDELSNPPFVATNIGVCRS